MRPRVLVDRHQWTRVEDWERLAQSVELVELKGEAPCSEGELIAALQGCQGLIKLGRRVPDLTRRVFESARDLKIVGLASDRFGTGIDLEAAVAHGLTVVDADNVASAQPVAEWALALILLCLRNAGAVYRQMMAGTETWARTGNEAFVNVFVTPHIAWYAPNALSRYFAHTALEIERFFKGEPLQYELTRRMVDIRHGRI